MKSCIFTLLLLCLSTGLALAQDAPTPAASPAGKVRMLALPIQFKGDYRPTDPATFGKLLEAEVEKGEGKVDIIRVNPDDPALARLDLSDYQDVGPLKALAAKYQCPLVTWLEISFEKKQSLNKQAASIDPAGLDPSVPYRYLVTVGGVARIQVIDVEHDKIRIQGPMAVFESDTTRAPDGTFDDLEQELANRCVGALARKIVEVTRSRLRLR